MGMHYNVTYHDAVIPPENYASLIEMDPEEARTVAPATLARLALEHLSETLSEWCDPEQNAEGIHLDGEGFQDGASYSYQGELLHVLYHCKPGAYIHDIDAEEGTGGQSRVYKMPDGSLREVYPEIVWPDPTNERVPAPRPELTDREAGFRDADLRAED